MNILIIEDELKTARFLKILIEKNQDCTVLGICDSIESSDKYLKQNLDKIDLIFMDIQLADGLSFDIFSSVQINIPVVFCTAYDQYTLKAFKSNGVEYILKPFKDQEIKNAIEKVKNFVHTPSPRLEFDPTQIKELFEKNNSRNNQTFIVRNKEKMLPIQAREIAFIWLSDKIVYIFQFDGSKHYIFKSMEELEAILDKDQFFRINRQMIVNRAAIRDMEPYFNRKLIVNLVVEVPTKIVVSRLKVTPFLSWIENSN